MRRISHDAIKTLALFALIPVAIFLVFDLVAAPEPVVGTVVDEIHNELVTVEWVTSDGVVHQQNMELPPEWAGASKVPVYQHATFASISTSQMTGGWYLTIALAGLVAGLFVVGPRRKPQREAMIRMTGTGLGQ